MAITNASSWGAALARHIKTPVLKNSIANTVSGQTFSLWRATGIPTQGAIPTTWATPTKATQGAQVDFTTPAPGENVHLVGVWFAPVSDATLLVQDRCGHMGGLSGTVTTAQTVNGTIPTGRGIAPTGANAAWWLEWYGDTGSTAATATVTYTNQNGVSGRTTTVALSATMRASRSLSIIPTTAGDMIKSIQSVTLSVSTGSVGNFGVTLTRAAHMCPARGALSTTHTSGEVSLSKFNDDACIAHMMIVSTTSTGIVQASIDLGQA